MFGFLKRRPKKVAELHAHIGDVMEKARLIKASEPRRTSSAMASAFHEALERCEHQAERKARRKQRRITP